MKIRNQIYGIFGKKSSQGKMVHFDLPDRIHTLTNMDEASLILDGIIRQFPLIYRNQNQRNQTFENDMKLDLEGYKKQFSIGNENIQILRRYSL